MNTPDQALLSANTDRIMKKDLIRHISSLEKDMFQLLRQLVLIQSGTYNKSGIDRVAEIVSSFLSDASMNVELLKMPECGNMIRAWSSKADFQKPILLVGHMDTVFPHDTGFKHYHEDETRAYGPGVMDMKGGLVVGIFALKALSDLGFLEDVPVSLFFNSEEEIGSPYSRQFIEDMAARSRAAFVLEGGGLRSEVVVGRKGKIGLDLQVSGRAGHAGGAGLDKPSAVLEAAHKVIALERLNHPPDILVNVGQISGGMGPNSIAEHARLGVDVRFNRPEDEKVLLGWIEQIASASAVPETSSEIIITSSRPPMRTEAKIIKLYEFVLNVSRKYDVPMGSETRGGVSDANFIAAMGVPVLDGLGPCGDLDHSDQEYIIKKSMVERVILLAGSLLEF